MAKRILVVDDDQNMIKLISAFLTKKGFEVESVADGPSAVRKVQEIRPHLVILDIMMPGMDGTQVASALKENLETCEIPIIYLTALKRGSEGEPEPAYGSDVVLAKPFSADELLNRIHELI